MKNNFAVIFDMDGVIVDNYLFHKKAWKNFCDKYKLDFEKAFRSKVFGGTNRDHLETFFERSLSSEEVFMYETEKESMYRDLYRSHIQSVPGLKDFLKELLNLNIPIALATSSPAVNVKFVLSSVNLTAFFKVILDASHVTMGKPDPEIYMKSSALLNMPPENCIVFEDSKNGITAAQAAGMKVVALTTTHPADELPEVDMVIENFKDLDTLQLRNLL